MLMLYYRARVSQPQDPERAHAWITKGPIQKLRRGLEQVIGAVRNYSLAFEALDGMRGKYSESVFFLQSLLVAGIPCRANGITSLTDEIEGAFETAFRQS